MNAHDGIRSCLFGDDPFPSGTDNQLTEHSTRDKLGRTFHSRSPQAFDLIFPPRAPPKPLTGIRSFGRIYIIIPCKILWPPLTLQGMAWLNNAWGRNPAISYDMPRLRLAGRPDFRQELAVAQRQRGNELVVGRCINEPKAGKLLERSVGNRRFYRVEREHSLHEGAVRAWVLPSEFRRGGTNRFRRVVHWHPTFRAFPVQMNVLVLDAVGYVGVIR